MSVSTDYFNLHDKYVSKYGSNTLVLYQCGSFLEIYSLPEPNKRGPDIDGIASMLNITVTRKDKSKEIGGSNCYMAGVTLSAAKKYIDVLIRNDYTVVLVEEVTPAPSPRREVTQILSKSTYIDSNYQDIDYNYLSVVVIDEYEQLRTNKKLWAVGLSAIDISTGTSTIHEVISSLYDTSNAIDETIRFINTFQPKELVVYNKSTKPQEELVRLFELFNRQVHFIPTSNTLEKISYQNEFFQKTFNFSNMLSPIENLQLEHMDLARLSLLLLIQFIYDHNETLIKNIKIPKIFDNKKHLILENNAINQLNILENGQLSGKLSCLLNVINFTSTAIGKRALKNRLLLPITDPIELSSRYNAIEQLIPHIEKIDSIMKGSLDFERAQSKIKLLKYHPHELAKIDTTYQKIIQLDQFTRSINFCSLDTIDEFNEYYSYYKSTFNLDELSKYSLGQIDGNIFNKGVSPEIDGIYTNLEDIYSFLDAMIKKMTIGDLPIKWETNDRDGIYLTTTKIRWDKIKKQLKSFNINNIEIDINLFEVKTNKTIVKIDHPVIKDLTFKKHSYLDMIRKTCHKEYINHLEYINKTYEHLWDSIINFIGFVDCSKSAAKCAITFNYCKPKILSERESFIYSDSARHPIIEQLPSKTAYIPNWICLGNVPDELRSGDELPDTTMTGMLLYSCNSTGKSSYMKSIALNLVLAQSGHYCAAKSFVYGPFTKIMTRILSNDNLFKGLSSFAIEMLELRSILNRADSSTLVVADELANQSEVASGTAIVAATIKKLHDSNVKFVTATHFHQLPKIDMINDLPNIHHYHLEVKYNEATGILEYDRILRKGSGSSIYGLEVARALDLDKEVLDLANKIRKDLLEIPNQVVSTKRSVYNTNVYKDICEICKLESNGKKKTPAEDVHHIVFQESANEDGFIDHRHKNHLSNLVNLCKRHHDQIHKPYRNRQLVIKGYKQTSAGNKLEYEFIKLTKT